MAILTRSGRSAITASVKSQPLHLAWGTENDSWADQPPAPEPSETKL